MGSRLAKEWHVPAAGNRAAVWGTPGHFQRRTRYSALLQKQHGSVAKRPYWSVFLRKFEVFSAVRKRIGKIRKTEKIKNESTSALAIVLTGLHHDQGPCPIKSQRVEYR